MKSLILATALILSPLSLVAQDHWSSVRPGQMDRATLVRVLGSSYGRQATFDADYLVWTNRLGARELRVAFDVDGVVSHVVVVPMGTMREGDVVGLFGGSRQKISADAYGNSRVSYPIGGATVAYQQDGTVSSIELTGGIEQRGVQAVVQEAVTNQLMGFLTKRKKP